MAHAIAERWGNPVTPRPKKLLDRLSNARANKITAIATVCGVVLAAVLAGGGAAWWVAKVALGAQFQPITSSLDHIVKDVAAVKTEVSDLAKRMQTIETSMAVLGERVRTGRVELEEKDKALAADIQRDLKAALAKAEGETRKVREDAQRRVQLAELRGVVEAWIATTGPRFAKFPPYSRALGFYREAVPAENLLLIDDAEGKQQAFRTQPDMPVRAVCGSFDVAAALAKGDKGTPVLVLYTGSGRDRTSMIVFRSFCS
jgi:hypothetical protein